MGNLFSKFKRFPFSVFELTVGTVQTDGQTNGKTDRWTGITRNAVPSGQPHNDLEI